MAQREREELGEGHGGDLCGPAEPAEPAALVNAPACTLSDGALERLVLRKLHASPGALARAGVEVPRDSDFWALWREEKRELKARGYRVRLTDERRRKFRVTLLSGAEGASQLPPGFSDLPLEERALVALRAAPADFARRAHVEIPRGSPFWGVWREHKLEVRALGFRVHKNSRGGYYAWRVPMPDPPLEPPRGRERPRAPPPPRGQLGLHLEQTVDLEALAGGYVARNRGAERELQEATSVELRDYQLACASRMLSLKRCLNSSLMGTGKTAMAVAALAVLAARGLPEEGMSLCVAPAALCTQWALEFEKFAPQLTALAVRGTKKKRANIWAQRADVYVISYASLSTADWAEQIAPRLRAPRGAGVSCLILDEVSMCKNHKATRTHKVTSLAHSAEHCFSLSATPLENNPSDLWQVFDASGLRPFGSFFSFRSRFCTTATCQWGEEITGFVPRELQALKRAVASRMVKVPAAVAAEALPRVQSIKISVDVSERERRLCSLIIAAEEQSIDLEALELVTDDSVEFESQEISSLDLVKSLRLQQAVDCPWLLLDEDSPIAAELGGATRAAILRMKNVKSSEKIKALVEICAQLRGAGESAIVFTRFAKLVPVLVAAVNDDPRIGHGAARGAHGSMRPTPRARNCDDFKRGRFPFLIATDCLSRGFDAPRVSAVIIFDSSWNPAGNFQRSGRVARVSSTEQVKKCYTISARDADRATVDQRIARANERKTEMSDSADVARAAPAPAAAGGLTR